MNTQLKPISNPTNTTNSPSKRKNTAQNLVFLITGFLMAHFILLNIIYSQHPQGGWVTLFGNISTGSLITIVLFALTACLISLWRSAMYTSSSNTMKKKAPTYSKPTTFMSVSPE